MWFGETVRHEGLRLVHVASEPILLQVLGRKLSDQDSNFLVLYQLVGQT